MIPLIKKNNESLDLMERRSKKRISTNIDARFFYGNLFYSGTVVNISEKGMFINTKRCLASDSMFVILIRIEDHLLKVIAKVKRAVKNEIDCDGMGVELMSPSASYVEFVNRLRTAA